MSSSHSLTSIDVSEYDRIEAAMSESERGRWFLETYLQRNRAHDTTILLDAIARLEKVVTGEREQDQIGRVRGDVLDMAHAIARTKAEIAAIQTPDHDQSRLGGASAALDAIVRSTERATSDILGAAEHVQEAAWTLRESGSDAAICDELDRRATAIYTACSFQDLTAQRTARIIHTLRYLEERLTAMMAVWGDALDTVPIAPGEERGEVPADLSQSDVDRYLDMEAPVAAGSPPPVAAFPSVKPLAVADDIVFLDAAKTVDEAEAETPNASTPIAVDAPEAADEDEPKPAEGETAETRTAEADAPMDPLDIAIAAAAVQAQIDIASAFAEIDALSEDEKRALFS